MGKDIKRGLILMGGGARAAYQVGVLKAVAELHPRGDPSPFKIVCGTSAGAINAVSLATMTDNYHYAITQLLRVWGNFRVHQVFQSDVKNISKNALRWLATITLGGLGQRNPLSLLNRKPLRELLLRRLDFSRIQQVIDAGHLHALCVTASGYGSGQSVSFYQGSDAITPWSRVRRFGCHCDISIDHLMASSAIPVLFEAIKLHREFFGDGSMRQMAPLSSALHLGADRVLVIGNQTEGEDQRERISASTYPSFAKIAGHILDSIFLDSMEADLERLRRINKTIDVIPDRHLKKSETPLRRVDAYVLSPSIDLSKLAQDYLHELPRTIRYLLKGIGASSKQDSGLASYLLFEKGYCRELIRLGYQDAKKEQAMLEQFLAD